MFEKEAEEYADKSKSSFVVNEYGSTVYTQLDIELAFQKGVTFGYNKANEEAKDIINELLMNGYDESTRAKALDFLYPDKE